MKCTNKFLCHLVILLILYVITSFILLPAVCYFLPYSKLYGLFHDLHEMHQKADALNDVRFNKAKTYFNSLNAENSLKYYNQMLNRSNLDIAIAIVTVKRVSFDLKNTGYLSQAAASMDKLIKSNAIFQSKYLFLCNVDRHPEYHEEAHFISKFIPKYGRYDNSSIVKSERNDIYSRTVYGSNYEKETVDYMFCLETAMELNAKYVMMLEDDTIPCLSLFEVLHDKLTNEKVHWMLTNQTFSHIKLYYPQRWQGYANDVERITELLSYGMLGGGCFLLVYEITMNLYKCSTVSYGNRVLQFVFGAIYVITVNSVVGRQHVLDLRRILPAFYYFRESPGCCTQAMLYPYKVLLELIKFLGKDEILYGFHTDLAIWEFVKRTGYSAFQIEPNLFYHTGMYTSLKSYEYKDPQEFLFSECL